MASRYSRYHQIPLPAEHVRLAKFRRVRSRLRRTHIGEPPERAADIVRRALLLVQEHLPPGWSISFTTDIAAGHGADAIVELAGPDQVSAVLIAEAKRSVVTRDLPGLLARVRAYAEGISGPTVPLVIGRYLSPSARAWLEERSISYADATGNIRILLDRPALFLRGMGAERDPWRGPGRPRGTLRGVPAAQVVRALVDCTPPTTIPELVRRSGASTGATYRVAEFLEQEALIERAPRGPITTVRWRRILERWSEDYGFQRSNPVRTYLHPRGLPALIDALANSRDLRYAVTGSLAAQPFAAYAPPRLAMIYTDVVTQLAERLGLREVDTGANALVASTDYGVVFDRLVEVDGVKYTAPSQTAVDLLTGPGRSPAEAQALLDWMAAHEPTWRS
jgi:hypothetical protein